jgi:hypothetical protein
MRTKRCCDCGQVKRIELFDLDRHRNGGHAAYCKACRRQRQTRGGYGACRNRALWDLAARYPNEYQRYRQQARRELAPDTVPVQVMDRARGRTLAELSKRHRAEWHQRYQQLRAAHPDWTHARAFAVATIQQRRAHRQEYLELLAGYAGARLAGPKLAGQITRRAQRLLQLAHPEEYQALYAAERARVGNPSADPSPLAHPVTQAPSPERRRDDPAHPCATATAAATGRVWVVWLWPSGPTRGPHHHPRPTPAGLLGRPLLRRPRRHPRHPRADPPPRPALVLPGPTPGAPRDLVAVN